MLPLRAVFRVVLGARTFSYQTLGPDRWFSFYTRSLVQISGSDRWSGFMYQTVSPVCCTGFLVGSLSVSDRKENCAECPPPSAPAAVPATPPFWVSSMARPLCPACGHCLAMNHAARASFGSTPLLRRAAPPQHYAGQKRHSTFSSPRSLNGELREGAVFLRKIKNRSAFTPPRGLKAERREGAAAPSPKRGA